MQHHIAHNTKGDNVSIIGTPGPWEPEPLTPAAKEAQTGKDGAQQALPLELSALSGALPDAVAVDIQLSPRLLPPGRLLQDLLAQAASRTPAQDLA